MNAARRLKHKETAHMMGVSDGTLRVMRCMGRGPKFIKLGAAKQAGVVYLESDVLEWLEARKFDSTSAATVSHPDNA